MAAVRNLVARFRAMDPMRFDLALAIVAVIATVLEAALIDATNGGSRVQTALFGAAMVGPALALRRREPLLAAALFVGMMAVQTPFDSFVLPDLTTPFVAFLLLCYTAGRHLGGRRFWVAVSMLVAGSTLALALQPDWEGPLEILWLLLLFTPPVLAGRALRSRALLQRELRWKAERAEAEREERARQAVEEERVRIASELQAVVANGVSAMVVQAEAVPRVLAAGDPARAREAFEVIEETGRDALAEMRRLLGVLRRAGERPALAPQPSLARLDALADSARADGLSVRLEVEGDRRPLPPGLDLAAYRVLQEGLTAAAAGEASIATVRVRYRERMLELEVEDDRAAGHDGGVAIAAVRERVGLYGGHARVARREGAGFVLEARLPVEAAAPAAAGSPA